MTDRAKSVFSKEEYENLGKEVSKLGNEVKENAEIVRVLKDQKNPPAEKSKIDAAVEQLKKSKSKLEEITKQWRDADPNKLHIDRQSFDDLLTRRFFVIPAFEIYGGVAGLYDYGPPGCAVKANFINLWRQHFVLTENMLELDSTCLTPEVVLKTSGHVERFNDLMVKDVLTGACYRADKLLIEYIDNKLAEPNITNDLRNELTDLLPKIDSMDSVKIFAVIKKLNIKAPETNNDLSEPFPFNLMFGTMIGPTGTLQGYMRPETAQSIFVNFKRLLDYNGSKMPFAGATIGQAFRNEIAPRSGLLRVREFTLAEIEHFVSPNNKNHVKFNNVKDLQVCLFPRENQDANSGVVFMTVGKAVADGIIANQTVGYFLARTSLFLKEAGILPEGLRFRQHLKNEMAHYAQDCWDAEILTSYGWVECVGIADRACYDLSAHSSKSGVELTAFEMFDQPKDIEYLDKGFNKAALAKAFRANVPKIMAYFDKLSDKELLEFQSKLNSQNAISIEIEANNSVEIQKGMINFQTKTKKVTGENIFPHVVEPSFGIGRILYSILEHSYWVRPGKEQEKRAVLSLPASIAPYKCAVLPLSSNDVFTPFTQQIANELTYNNISFKVDESGQSIGKRYARTDELGVPFIITIDFDTPKDSTATLRERDSCTQVRAKLSEVITIVKNLIDKKTTWAKIREEYPEQKETASVEIGKSNNNNNNN